MWKYFWKNMRVVFGLIGKVAAIILGIFAAFSAIFILGWPGVLIDIVAVPAICCFVDAYQQYKRDVHKRHYDDKMRLEDAYDVFRARCYNWGLDQKQGPPARVTEAKDEFLRLSADYKSKWGVDEWVTIHEEKYLSTCEIYNLKP